MFWTEQSQFKRLGDLGAGYESSCLPPLHHFEYNGARLSMHRTFVYGPFLRSLSMLSTCLESEVQALSSECKYIRKTVLTMQKSNIDSTMVNGDATSHGWLVETAIMPMQSLYFPDIYFRPSFASCLSFYIGNDGTDAFKHIYRNLMLVEPLLCVSGPLHPRNF